MVSKDEIIAALRQVNDPDIGKGIVELDSVKNVQVQETSIKVSVQLTEKILSMNMLVENFIDQIKRVLKELPGVQEVLVETLSMSKEQQEKLYALKAQQTRPRPVADKGIDRLSKMSIKHIIAIISGKGGVGKTLVTGLLAVELRRLGFSVGILDADVTGPSIPKIFGVRKSPTVINESKLDPPRSKTGIKLISMNVLLGEKEEAATIWRGPIINSVIRQLYNDVEWGTLDYLLVDLPPGCVTADTTVYANSEPTKISQLKAGDYVYSVNAQISRYRKGNKLTAALERKRVLEVVPQGESEVFELRTKSRALRATFNHPVLSLSKLRLLSSRFWDYSLTWRRLADLRPRDIIVVIKKLPEIQRASYALPRISLMGTKDVKIPSVISDDFARLVGYFLGDGFVRITPKTRTYQLMFAEPRHSRYRPYYVKLLRKIFGQVSIYDDSNQFELISHPVAELFRILGLYRHALNKRVPEWIFNLPTSQKLALLQGYCDADGHRRRAEKLFRRDGWMTFESPNRLLMDDLRTLCIMIGLRVTNLYSRRRTLKPPSGITHTSEFWGFETSDRSRSSKYGAGLIRGEIGLGLVNDYVGFERVTRMTHLGRQQVYDLKVEDNENFIADGIIVHNTSDAPLTVFQSIPLDGVVVVTSPQELAWMIVKKAVNMARQLNVTILGLFENMSYVKCPDCGKDIHAYGKSRGENAAKSAGIPFLGSLPIDPQISSLCDDGRIEEYRTPHTAKLVEAIKAVTPKTVESAPAFPRHG